MFSMYFTDVEWNLSHRYKDYPTQGRITSHDMFYAVYVGNINFLRKNTNETNINLINKDGYSLIEYALAYSQLQIAQFLINTGANLDRKSTTGISVRELVGTYKLLITKPALLKKSSTNAQINGSDHSIEDSVASTNSENSENESSQLENHSSNFQVDLIAPPESVTDSCCILM